MRACPCVLLATIALGATPARAQVVGVVADGCPPLVEPLAQALRLEVAEGWRVVEGAAELVLTVELSDCAAPRWTLRLGGASGDAAGPEAIDLGPVDPGARARIAARWAAERLSPARSTLEDPRTIPVPDPPAPAAPAPVPAAPVPRAPAYPRLVVMVGAGYAFGLDPVELSQHAVFARAGAFAHVLDWLLVGGSLEGGAIFEPFGHAQPLLRSCIEPQAMFDVASLRVALGPKACLSVSRHLRGTQDHWASGAAFGGLLRLTMPFDSGLAIVFRVDADAWERDVFVETPPGPFGGAPFVALPWAGLIAASTELEIR